MDVYPSRAITFSEASKIYGPIVGGKWTNERLFMVGFSLYNWPLPWVNGLTGHPVTTIYVNRDMATPLERAFANLKAANLTKELKTFDGCFAIRDVRGMPGYASAHSYGLAIDINAKTNPLGGPADLSPQFVKCFEDAGFDWGGNFTRHDPMHFSYAWEDTTLRKIKMP